MRVAAVFAGAVAGIEELGTGVIVTLRLGSVVSMTRVWLTTWEWECCGDPFVVGDDVDFGISARTPEPFVTELLGPELAETIDAFESHHEEEFADRVRGRVVGIHAVVHDVEERRSLRRPGHGAPPDAAVPAEGEEWPMNRLGLGEGVFAGSRPSRYVTTIVDVPGTAALQPRTAVRVPTDEDDSDTARPEGDVDADDPPAVRLIRARAGWIVDVDEG